MKYIIDKNNRPVYLQLYNMLRNDIVNGVYEFNSKLPSKRVLAEETGVSTITIEHAYALLCDEGYAEGRARSGYVVIFRPSDGFASATRQERRHSSAFHAEHSNTDFPLSVLSKTMRRVLCDRGDLLLEKSPNLGCTELREAIRRYLARNRGISVETDQIIIGSGSEYLYGLIVELLGQKKIYGIETPSYKKIEEVYNAFGVTIEKLPLQNDGIESSALHQSKADILHISPYRSYPSGVSASASKRHEYIKWSSTNNRYIIEDDFESEFSISRKPEETLFSHSSQENVIYMNTFSKTISPSLRVGYMVLPTHLVSQFDEKLGFYSCTVPT